MPFARTALFSAVDSENISHFNAVRIRVVGEGNLDLKFISMDEINECEIPSIAMKTATNIQPTVLCNFVEQRAQVEISTDDQDEIFKINRIILFTKELFSSYPA